MYKGREGQAARSSHLQDRVHPKLSYAALGTVQRAGAQPSQDKERIW
jgi:hypothetical protein